MSQPKSAFSMLWSVPQIFRRTANRCIRRRRFLPIREARPYSGGRGGVQSYLKEYPFGRFSQYQVRCGALGQPKPRIPRRGQSRQRLKRVFRAREHRNSNHPEDRRPGFPSWHLPEIVRAHQPYEAAVPAAAAQRAQRIHSVARAEPLFEIGDTDTRVARHGRGGIQPGRQRRHARAWLERVLR